MSNWEATYVIILIIQKLFSNLYLAKFFSKTILSVLRFAKLDILKVIHIIVLFLFIFLNTSIFYYTQVAYWTALEQMF